MNMAEVLICEICGGTDGDNELVHICTKCRLTKEHSYCMRCFPEGDKPWVCEECMEPKQQVIQDPRGLSPTAGPSRSRYPVKKYVKLSKVKQITEEEVKKLNSGTENVRTSKTTIISRPRKMLHKNPPRIPSGFAKNGRDGGRNIYLTFSPSATRRSEGVDTLNKNVVKMKKPVVPSSTPVEYQHQFIKDVGIEALNTNAEETTIRSQKSLTLVGRTQQSHQAVRVKDLPSGEQEIKKASGTPLTSVQKQNQLITNAEETMIRSQKSLTLAGRTQQSHQAVRVKDLQSGEQEIKKASGTPLTSVQKQNQLITNAEETMIRSQKSLTLVGRTQQSHQSVRVNDLQSGEQEIKKASGTPLTSVQKQNQLIKGSTSCASLDTMKLDVEDIATLVQKLWFYEPYFPAKCASWTGRCKIRDHAEGGKFHEGLMAQLSSRVREAYGLSLELPVELQAHPAARINCKAYELSLKMAVEHEFNFLPRSDIWTLLFHDDSPDLRDIALYIFPTAKVKSSEDNYAKLLECMEAEDFAIRTDVDGFELLIFSSKHLHTDIQDVICYWSRKRFFCGVFRQAKAAIQVALPVPDHDHSNIDDPEDVEMEVDLEGGKEIGLADIVVKKNHDDHSSFHDQEEVAMEVDMEGGNDLGPPEIVVRENYGGKTANGTPSKVTTDTGRSTCTTMHNESGKKTVDSVKEAAFPAEFGKLSSKKCKLEPALIEKSANRMDVQCLINVKVERQDPECSSSILWTPPPADWVKLNVAVSTSSKGTRAAGIIRNSTAKWLVGYNLNLGRSESRSLEAQFQALHEGLKLAWEGGFRKVVVELESSAAVESLLKNTYLHRDPNTALISSCKERIRSKWECKLQVCSKEGNSSAQLLAEPYLCKSEPSGLNILKDPPDALNLFLQLDGEMLN